MTDSTLCGVIEELTHSNDETGTASPPTNRLKQKVLQRYRVEYAVKYPVIRKSSLGDIAFTMEYCMWTLLLFLNTAQSRYRQVCF